MEIELSKTYLLDGKTKVVVLKATNRSKTYFNIEIPGKGIESVENDRLKPFLDLKDETNFYDTEIKSQNGQSQ